MNRKLFDKTLDFEINLIGYKNKGESIVFFLKADGKAVYAGLVDCFEYESENLAVELLKSEQLPYFDFVCWTHPHDDHTIGMDKILNEFCDNNTSFWIPPFLKNDIMKYSSNAQEVYKIIFEILESKSKNKMRIREASDAKILEQFECSGNSSMNPYIFQIRSFAPDSDLLNTIKVKERLDKSNIYSIGLILNIGHFYIVLAGDVEDRTIKIIPDFNIDVKDKMDYLKIPHHSSGSSSYLIDRFRNCDIESPTVATTTVYRRYSLPDKKVLKMYFAWGKESVIYATGDIENVENDCEKNGVIKTVFDITERKNVPIETALFGNAVCIGRDI